MAKSKGVSKGAPDIPDDDDEYQKTMQGVNAATQQLRDLNSPANPFNPYNQQIIEGLATKTLKGYQRGGKVKKTGIYKLHKGETVIPRGGVLRSRTK